jgi:hypothetical protein
LIFELANFLAKEQPMIGLLFGLCGGWDDWGNWGMVLNGNEWQSFAKAHLMALNGRSDF